MKNFRFLIAAAAVLSLASSAFASEYKVDASHSSVGFSIRHLVSKVQGGFKDFDGMIVYDEKKPEGAMVDFKIKAASINTNNDKRDEHLRNDDFFAVAKFPEITFKSKKAEKAGKDKVKLSGDMTMHGVTKPATFMLEYNGQAKDMQGMMRAGFSATTKVNRKDYGIIWNKALDGGGVVLGDEVDVNVQIEAVAAMAPAAEAAQPAKKK